MMKLKWIFLILSTLIIKNCYPRTRIKNYEAMEGLYDIKYMKANDSIFHYNEHEHNKTDFCAEYCDVKKRVENTHTMCAISKTNKLKTKCSSFRIYPKVKLNYDYGFELEKAHNGIRNRIAAKMRVANMQQILWDDELNLMAELFLRKCQFYVDDRCAHLSFNYTAKSPIWRLLAMNRYTMHSEFYPIDIIEQAIQAWYGEKNIMSPPSSREIGDAKVKSYIGQIFVDNNFTHMSYPQLQKFGCSLATNAKLYCLVCYYYPYIKEKYEFRYGKCCKDCNYHYALQSTNFSNLCSNNNEVNSLGNVVFLNYGIILILMILIIC